MQLVFVALGCRAALKVADVRALVGDDQGALELAGVLLVDAEVGRQLHRAAHARRNVDERTIRKHRAVQCREEIVGDRHNRSEIFFDEFRMRMHRLRNRAENHARLQQLVLERRDDRHRVEHRIDRHARPLDAREDFLLAQGNAELLIGAQQFGIDVLQRLRPRR